MSANHQILFFCFSLDRFLFLDNSVESLRFSTMTTSDSSSSPSSSYPIDDDEVASAKGNIGGFSNGGEEIEASSRAEHPTSSGGASFLYLQSWRCQQGYDSGVCFAWETPCRRASPGDSSSSSLCNRSWWLKNFRPQLYSAADYCWWLWWMLLITWELLLPSLLISLISRVLTNQLRSWGLLVLPSNLLTCRTYIDKEGLRPQQLLAVT